MVGSKPDQTKYFLRPCTYPTVILDTDGSSFFNKVFYCVLVVFAHCNMQGTPLIKRKKPNSITHPPYIHLLLASPEASELEGYQTHTDCQTSTVSSTVLHTYPIVICDVTISSFVNKEFHHMIMAFSSCHVQGSPLIERNQWTRHE